MTGENRPDTLRRRASVDCESSAFGREPRLGDPRLAGHAAGTAHEHWCQGVALGAAGRYAAALRVLEPMTRAAAARRSPAYASLAASTIASHRRQLGAHAAAYRMDAFALRLLGAHAAEPSTAAAEARTDALLGLAADAIGLGVPTRCDELLRYVHDRAQGGGWRSRIRFGWVRTEWSLAVGRGAEAVETARATYAYARQAPSGRHVTKSAMQMAVCLLAHETEGGRDQGAQLAREVLASSLHRGLTSLVWPTALLLSGINAEGRAEFREQARVALTSVLNAADATGRRLALGSPWMPIGLLQESEHGDTPSLSAYLNDKEPDRVKVETHMADR